MTRLQKVPVPSLPKKKVVNTKQLKHLDMALRNEKMHRAHQNYRTLMFDHFCYGLFWNYVGNIG